MKDQQWLERYELAKTVPVPDEDLRQWLLDAKTRGSLEPWEPHVELRMQRIFARLREFPGAFPTIVDAIEMYVQYRIERAAKGWFLA